MKHRIRHRTSDDHCRRQLNTAGAWGEAEAASAQEVPTLDIRFAGTVATDHPFS